MREHRSEWQRLRQLAESAPILDAALERQLLEEATQGEPRATKQIVQSHMRLVLKIAARYQRGGLCADDLVSEGVLGLMEALRRFDLTRGVRFAGYASWWIRARVSQYAFANRRAVGVPSTRSARSVIRELRRAEHRLSQRFLRTPTEEELARELGVSPQDVGQVSTALSTRDLPLDQPHVADEAETPEQMLAQRQQDLLQRVRVQEALRLLSVRERALVNEQYLAEEGRSLAQLGQAFGVSRQRLGQVLSSARDKLKAELVNVA